MNLSSLKKKAHRGSLEVEDILAVARERIPGLSDELQKIAKSNGWYEGKGLGGDGKTPVMARWVEVASQYSDNGFPGLLILAEDLSKASFVLGLVQTIRTKQSIEFVFLAYGNILVNPHTFEDLAWKIANSLNLMLSFERNAAPTTATQRARLQEFCFALYSLANTESNRALALLALRGVGDLRALDFISTCRAFADPWEEVTNATKCAIKKRLV